MNKILSGFICSRGNLLNVGAGFKMKETKGGKRKRVGERQGAGLTATEPVPSSPRGIENLSKKKWGEKGEGERPIYSPQLQIAALNKPQLCYGKPKAKDGGEKKGAI